MKGFELKDGDVAIAHNEISMVSGNGLKTQTIQSVLSTNKGECLFNTDEGIDFNAILGVHRAKSKEGVESILQDEIEQGIAQVDDTLVIDEFSCLYDADSRKLKVLFAAKTESGEIIAVSNEY